MAFFKDFGEGVATYRDAHRLIVKHRLWFYVFTPGIINLALIILIISLAYFTGNILRNWLFEILGLNQQFEGFVRYLIYMLHYFVKFAVYFLYFMAYNYTYKYIVLMIMSPLLALLSEKTEELLTGIKNKFSFMQLLKDIRRGIIIVIRNLFIELGFSIVLFFLSYIPILGYICPFITFHISMYFYGFSMIDYTNERHKLSIGESVSFVRNHKGFAVANGMFFYLILMIPLVGLLVAPSYAVVAATIGVHKLKQ